MTDTKQDPKVAEAEEALGKLEVHQNNIELAANNLQYAKEDLSKGRAKQDAVDKAQAEYDAAVNAMYDANIDPEAVRVAAQTVLAARGEAHTETGILPPNHGIRTVSAEAGVARALGDIVALGHTPATDKALADAQAALDKAEKDDAADKLAAANANHKNTTDALQEAV